jgi:hypothetical protein
MADHGSQGRTKQAKAQSAFMHTEKGKALNRDRALHMIATRDQEETNRLSSEARKLQLQSNSLLPPLETVGEELALTDWETVSWNHTISIQILKGRMRGPSGQSVRSISSNPIRDPDQMALVRSMGFSLKWLVLFHPAPIRSADLADGLFKLKGVSVANVQHDRDFGKAAAICGETRNSWLTTEDITELVAMSSKERVARVFLQQSGGAMCKEGALDDWRSFIDLEMNGNTWGGPHWCPRGIKEKKRKNHTEHPKESNGEQEEMINPCCGSDDTFPYEEDFLPSLEEIFATYHRSEKQTARVAWQFAVKPCVLQREVGLSWPPLRGASHLVEGPEMLSRFAKAGFSASFLALVCSEPVTTAAIFYGVKQSICFPALKRIDTGKASNLLAASRESWFSQTEVQELVEDLGGDQRRMTSIFFQQCGDDVRSEKRQKCWILWRNFVEAECRGKQWIGYHFGWNPSKLTDAEVYECFKLIVEIFHSTSGKPKRSSVTASSSSSSMSPLSSTPLRIGVDLPCNQSRPSETVSEGGPVKKFKGGQCKKIVDSRIEIITGIQVRFPNLIVPEAIDDNRWRAALTKGKDSVLLFVCNICNVQVNRKLVNIRSGASPICPCHMTTKGLVSGESNDNEEGEADEEGEEGEADEEGYSDIVVQEIKDLPADLNLGGLMITDTVALRRALHPRYTIDAFISHIETSWAKPQQQLYFTSTCQRCGMKNETVCKRVRAGHSPACWCTCVAPWKGENGYGHLQDIVTRGVSTRFFKLSVTLEWWLANVKNSNSKVSLTCTLCSSSADVRISSIQQGIGGVGCRCTLHGALAVRTFLESFGCAWKPEHPVVRSRVTGRSLQVDLALGVDEPEDLQVLQGVLGLTLESSPKLPIFVEIDGSHHFTLTYDGRLDERYLRRDYEKEVAILQMPAVLIRVTHKTVMTQTTQGYTHWHSFLRQALIIALSQNKGCILHETSPCYIELQDNFYVDLRKHEDSHITDSILVDDKVGLVHMRVLKE